ncbi:NAD(P)H-binding protein [Spirosoma sp. HMF3257]|uniref:NAD(P)-binding domain-containing protein n=1 Tax=Spirosoma telluris TaxID=2183553 RepID=A0A327NHE7_9BACT|nr:NAD(P)H-binding protein [Spirosoma telluris]RAI74243.1 hypothetical protein HMF3257_07710 [Spirosoma telluris]
MKPVKILIAGGNGFVGRQICQLAAQQGIHIVSLSRTGQPLTLLNDTPTCIEWVKADVFDVDSWRAHLQDCTAVLHSIGIIEEKPEQGLTFERVILESTRVVALAAKQKSIRRFVYLSASAGAPETPQTYMDNKVAAENFLRTLGFSLTILRPGLIYGSDKPETIIENEQIQQLLTDPHIGPHIRAHRPLPVESVAKVALRACLQDMDELLDVDAIERIATENL